MEIKRPSRWSYSALSTYKGCPAQYKYSYIDGLSSPPSAAMARGTRLHTLCEDYVTGKITHMPNDLRKISLRLEDLRQRQAQAEAVWLLDKEWSPVADQSKAWIKAIVDVHWLAGDVLHLADYKSGNSYPEHDDQLQLYGILGLQQYPEAKRVEYSAIYIDSGTVGAVGGLIRPMAERLREKWHSDAIIMEADTEFQPKPGSACNWCPFKPSKGGPCAVGK